MSTKSRSNSTRRRTLTGCSGTIANREGHVRTSRGSELWHCRGRHSLVDLGSRPRRRWPLPTGWASRSVRVCPSPGSPRSRSATRRAHRTTELGRSVNRASAASRSWTRRLWARRSWWTMSWRSATACWPSSTPSMLGSADGRLNLADQGFRRSRARPRRDADAAVAPRIAQLARWAKVSPWPGGPPATRSFQ